MYISFCLASKDAISSCPAGLPQNLQNPIDTEKSIYEKSKSSVSVLLPLLWGV